MTTSWKIVIILAGCVLVAPLTWTQTEQATGVRNSFGLRAGYSIPVGDWRKSRVAPAIDLFKGGLALEADLEFRLSDRWGLAVAGGYADFNGGDWESYAKSTGDQLSVSASGVHAALLVRPYVLLDKANMLKLEVGAVAFFASGKETFNGQTYEYDFFKSFRLGIRGGIAYERLLSDNIAATVSAAGLVIPSGVEYADGVSFTVFTLPLTAGVRFYF